MLISLLSTSNYNSYNIEIANLMGLHEAIHLNELININEKALRKGKVEDSFFVVDREYIQKRTTIKPEEQREIERALCNSGIVQIGEEKDTLSLNMTALTNLLMDGNEKLLKAVTNEVKTRQKINKAEIIRQQLKKNIKTTNPELVHAYSDWIDSVSMKRGYMPKKAVLQGEQLVDEFSNRNLDIALKVLSIATIQSYVDMNWAINDYNKDFKNSFKENNIIQTVQQLGTEVF